jgi:hypothetical protein
VKLLADENFDGRILRALVRRRPDVDFVRAVDEGLGGWADPELLTWAADHGRILLTHDVSTMVRFAYERVRTGLPMPGVIEVPDWLPIARAVGDLEMFVVASRADEWKDQVLYLPF